MGYTYQGVCEFCNKEYTGKGKKYCCRACWSKQQSAEGSKDLNCEVCGEKFKTNNYEIENNNTKNCSYKCAGVYRRKNKVFEFMGENYYYRKQDSYFYSTNNKKTLLHRDIWEKSCCAIPSGFVVHHIDHDKSNNDLYNLMLMKSTDHRRYHSKQINNQRDVLGRYIKKEKP